MNLRKSKSSTSLIKIVLSEPIKKRKEKEDREKKQLEKWEEKRSSLLFKTG